MEVLYLVTILTIKHFLADFTPLQTHYMLANKGTYGHWGGISHAGVHAILSIIVLVIASIGFAEIRWAMIFCICIGEFFIHYHMDWFKEYVCRVKEWKSTDYPFWGLFGIDQLVHHLTYIAMIWVYAIL
ncbi:MAG: DUF3307 domain-containing protein [Candidatus Marinimicrobia bacterium]|nr:DUF3307 domain-containing protein [Candidatus Neomarinimicrobiota bacterium]